VVARSRPCQAIFVSFHQHGLDLSMLVSDKPLEIQPPATSRGRLHDRLDMARFDVGIVFVIDVYQYS
jgi:hypothetical protein